jgi:hypothetical protein
MFGKEQISFGIGEGGVGYAIGRGFNPSPPPNNKINPNTYPAHLSTALSLRSCLLISLLKLARCRVNFGVGRLEKN